jgi:hypothetical protein
MSAENMGYRDLLSRQGGSTSGANRDEFKRAVRTGADDGHDEIHGFALPQT